jgi:hypothetical protein
MSYETTPHLTVGPSKADIAYQKRRASEAYFATLPVQIGGPQGFVCINTYTGERYPTGIAYEVLPVFVAGVAGVRAYAPTTGGAAPFLAGSLLSRGRGGFPEFEGIRLSAAAARKGRARGNLPFLYMPGPEARTQPPARTTDVPVFSKPSSIWDYRSQMKGLGAFDYSTPVGPKGNAKDVVVYWVINKKTRQVLKVGDTTVGSAVSNWQGNTLKYARKYGVSRDNLTVGYIIFDKSVNRRSPYDPETLLRKQFENQGHQLPWDRERGRNPDNFIEAP